MTDSSNVPTKIVEIVDLDTAMYRLRLAGKSCRMIAKELRVPEDRVRETIEKMLTPVTPKLKAQVLELELERLDEYQASQHQAAAEGNRNAIAMCLRISEARADLLGLRAPASVRLDPVQLVAQAEPKLTSTQDIRAVLDQIVGSGFTGALPKPTNGTPPNSEPSELDEQQQY